MKFRDLLEKETISKINKEARTFMYMKKTYSVKSVKDDKDFDFRIKMIKKSPDAEISSQLISDHLKEV